MLSSLFTPTDRITAPIWFLTSCCFLFSLENKIQGFINFFTWKKLISSLKQAQHPFPAENLRIEGAKCHPNYFTLNFNQPTVSWTTSLPHILERMKSSSSAAWPGWKPHCCSEFEISQLDGVSPSIFWHKPSQGGWGVFEPTSPDLQIQRPSTRLSCNVAEVC